ncbi:hypothetical protein ACWGDX_13135 [Streptomyces sp. NPDC055025]
MTAYAIQLDKADDLVVDDEHLTIDLTAGWAVFNDPFGTALAIPASRIRSIQRLDEPEDEHVEGA